MTLLSKGLSKIQDVKVAQLDLQNLNFQLFVSLIPLDVHGHTVPHWKAQWQI